MTICTYNARTLASEASVEDLMMQARKIKYDVIGLTEKTPPPTRRLRLRRRTVPRNMREQRTPPENVMRELEWEDMGVKVDGRQLHHLRFADDIVLITPSISQAERMLADFDRVFGNVGLQLKLTKTMFMRDGQVSDAPFSLNGTNISECSSYVYLGREVNMANDLGWTAA
ncbi:unnamed protein product [Heligmosomoides polygyrus]|uniref:Reverse transcriptase domain-containing protein n=1 Tax=Heligmosomoides polygyrus TaxID=6339 RepID=A0A183GQU0_HELPZ|nr:unnamed protein product [Heligmosomoides polygyrus]